MKKVLFATLAMAFALISFTACDKKDDDGGNGGNGGGTGKGKQTEVITGTEDVAGVVVFGDDDENELFTLAFKDGKMSLDFPALKAEDLVSMPAEGLTITPSSAKGMMVYFDAFDADDNYIGEMEMIGKTDDEVFAFYMYVDRDVTVKGTENDGDGDETVYDLKLKKGWNKVYGKEEGPVGTDGADLTNLTTTEKDVMWVFNEEN